MKIKKGKMINRVNAGVVDWVMEDCGDIFEPGMEISDVQLEAHQPVIFESSKNEKMFKQIYLNRFAFVGTIEAILATDTERANPISNFLRKLDLSGKEWPEQKKEIMEKGYDSVLKKSKLHPLGQNTSVDAILVDCGIPVRLNYGHRENLQLLKKWGWGHFLPTLHPGMWIAGEFELYLLTCVDDGLIRKTISGKISDVYKLIKDPVDKDFGKVLEISSSGDPFKVGNNEIFVTMDVNEIGKLGHDTEGRICEVLT